MMSRAHLRDMQATLREELARVVERLDRLISLTEGTTALVPPPKAPEPVDQLVDAEGAAPVAEAPAAVDDAPVEDAPARRQRGRYTDAVVLEVKRDLAITGSSSETAKRLNLPVTAVYTMRASKRWQTLELDGAAAAAMPEPEVAPSAIDDDVMRAEWPNPKVRRLDLAQRFGVGEHDIARRARELGLPRKASNNTPPAAMPPPDIRDLEPVPASEEDARDWLYAQLRRERKSDAEIEQLFSAASSKAIFAGCNARRARFGLPPYQQLERSA